MTQPWLGGRSLKSCTWTISPLAKAERKAQLLWYQLWCHQQWLLPYSIRLHTADKTGGGPMNLTLASLCKTTRVAPVSKQDKHTRLITGTVSDTTAFKWYSQHHQSLRKPPNTWKGLLAVGATTESAPYMWCSLHQTCISFQKDATLVTTTQKTSPLDSNMVHTMSKPTHHS